MQPLITLKDALLFEDNDHYPIELWRFRRILSTLSHLSHPPLRVISCLLQPSPPSPASSSSSSSYHAHVRPTLLYLSCLDSSCAHLLPLFWAGHDHHCQHHHHHHHHHHLDPDDDAWELPRVHCWRQSPIKAPANSCPCHLVNLCPNHHHHHHNHDCLCNNCKKCHTGTSSLQRLPHPDDPGHL